MNSLHLHPNFKLIIKNRLLSHRHPFVIKNNEGSYLLSETIRSTRSFTIDIINAVRYTGWYANGKGLFADAKIVNGRIFVTTVTGEIEIFEKDFQ